MDVSALVARLGSWRPKLPPTQRSSHTIAVVALSVVIVGFGAASLPGLVPELPEGWDRAPDQRDMASRIGDRPDPISLLAISPEPLAAPIELGALPDAIARQAPQAGPGIAVRFVSETAEKIVMGRPTAIDRMLPPGRARAEIQRAVFPKWSGVMEKSYAWDADFDGVCGEIVGRPCGLRLWQDRLRALSGESPMVQLDRVNRLMNEVRYREDLDTWGTSDYWATPGEFFAYGGDCEDFAVAKYYSLRALGFSAEQMRIVVLEDLRLDRAHAVLVVDVEGRELMLDNQYRTLMDWRSAEDYRPFYSVNEDTFEIHEALRERGRGAA